MVRHEELETIAQMSKRKRKKERRVLHPTVTTLKAYVVIQHAKLLYSHKLQSPNISSPHLKTVTDPNYDCLKKHTVLPHIVRTVRQKQDHQTQPRTNLLLWYGHLKQNFTYNTGLLATLSHLSLGLLYSVRRGKWINKSQEGCVTWACERVWGLCCLGEGEASLQVHGVPRHVKWWWRPNTGKHQSEYDITASSRSRSAHFKGITYYYLCHWGARCVFQTQYHQATISVGKFWHHCLLSWWGKLLR